MTIARYAYIETGAHGYLQVPWEDFRSVMGWDHDDDAEEILSYCPVDESSI